MHFVRKNFKRLLNHRRLCLVNYLMASVFVSACNKFDEPVSVDPQKEVETGTNIISARNEQIVVPQGWRVNSIYRDETGLARSIDLERIDHRGRVARMMFENQGALTENPLAEEKTDTLSTKHHQNVTYYIGPSYPPSGDDTPGHYSISAVIELNGRYWYLHVGFFAPIDQDLKSLVYYIDALTSTKTHSAEPDTETKETETEGK